MKKKYKENEIKDIKDEFGFIGAKPYIYTNGKNDLYCIGKVNHLR